MVLIDALEVVLLDFSTSTTISMIHNFLLITGQQLNERKRRTATESKNDEFMSPPKVCISNEFIHLNRYICQQLYIETIMKLLTVQIEHEQ